MRVRPRHMLRESQGIVILADGPPRNNPRGTRLRSPGVVRRYRMPGADLPLHSSAGPGPSPTAANTSAVAGRLAPFAERPTHT